MKYSREKLLLHACCAPCSIYAINQLLDKFELSVYFFNPNIFPEEEYWQRLSEIRNFCQKHKINYIEADYAQTDWFKFTKGYENAPEKDARCNLCFLFRLGRTAEFAQKNGFDWFSTTLTMGRQKKSLQVLAAGRKVESRYRVKFLDQDFKKNYGTQISDWLAGKLGLYKQNYCGCVFSRKP